MSPFDGDKKCAILMILSKVGFHESWMGKMLRKWKNSAKSFKVGMSAGILQL